MKVQTEKAPPLQWHPAFYAALQVELAEDADKLAFESEHQLGTRPKEIDVLIIKKEDSAPVHKNLGRLFRRHNIVEYKSPTDYLSVDDFYKVYGYACFYKSDAKGTDSIKAEDITLSFVCHNYPRELMRHLEQVRGYRAAPVEQGIYYIHGDYFPMQLILTRKLPAEENLWLKSLTNQLKSPSTAERLVREYGEHKDNTFYESMMNLIVRANLNIFKEVKDMCEALEELMKDKFEERESIAEARGITRGITQGITQGEKRVNSLNARLAKAGRTEDIIRASTDKVYQEKMFTEFGI